MLPWLEQMYGSCLCALWPIMAGRPAWKGQKKGYWFVCLSNEIGYTLIKFVGSRPLIKLCLNVLVIHGDAFSVLCAQTRLAHDWE